MSETMYDGYIIIENDDGYYQIGNVEFPTYDEALEWVDSEKQDFEPSTKLHTYIFYYIDNYTDSCYSEEVIARSRYEAEILLRRNNDVYHIVDCYRVK